jgi:hypothetical protein
MAIGLAVNIREGLYTPVGLRWLTLALVLVIGAILSWRPRQARAGPGGPGWLDHRLAAAILGLAILVQLVPLLLYYPGSVFNAPPGSARKELSELYDYTPWMEDPGERQRALRRLAEIEHSLDQPMFRVGLLVVVGFAGLSLLPARRLSRMGLSMMLGAYLALGIHWIGQTPDPHIDVWVFQQESSAALLQGRNPYDITFTNIYGDGAKVYGAELMKDGRVNFGFPYAPLSLYMALPGYAIGGDHRYSQLVAIVLAAALIATIGPGLLPKLAAMLLLFSPRIFMIVEMAWTEPLVILLLCATVWCAVRMPRLTPWVFGLFLASKQYLIFAIPLAALLIEGLTLRRYLIFMLKAAAIAIIVSAPLVLWNVPAFIYSAITLQLKQPFRDDALGYLAHLWWQGHRSLAPRLGWMGLVLPVPVVALLIWKGRQSLESRPAFFAAGLALVYMVFLLFSKQAFCNYYLLPIAALCCAIAADPAGREGDADHDRAGDGG